MLKLLIFSGSSRKGNYTQHVAAFVQLIAAQDTEWEVDLVSPESLGLKFDDEGEQAKPQYPALTEKVIAADAYLIVAPEYNHGYSGSLKYMFDLHFGEYKHKPVGIVGVSNGIYGGARMIEALLPVLRTASLVTIKPDVTVTNDEEEIKDGQFVDPAKWQKRVDRVLIELKWMAKTLKWGRENLPQS